MNFKLTSTKENSVAVTEQLINQLKVNVASDSIKKKLEEHPNFPSLLAISDGLVEWGIDSQSYQLDKAEFDKDDLYYPFIAHFGESGGRFVLVKSIENNKVYLSDETNNNIVLPESEFLKRWTGNALHATANEKSGETNYRENRFKGVLNSLMAPVGLLLLTVVLYFAFSKQETNWSMIALSLLKLCGMGISVLLLMQSINANNPFIKNLCTLNGKNDCNAILKSDAAKVTSWLSWSEVGFFYFTGSFLSLLFAPSSLLTLAWLNLFALPYTIYSITYQYRNKNWCILCCSVQVILVLEALTFLSTQNFQLSTFNFSPQIIAWLAVTFLAPILTWSFLKPFFIDASQLKSLKQQLKKFKYNSDLFNQALKNQPKYGVPDDLMPVILGNPNAETTITMVSNPFCGPCAKAHETLDNLLDHFDNVKIKIIIPASKSETDPRKQVAKHFNLLNKMGNNVLVKNALTDWYSQNEKNYKNWARKYPVELNDSLDNIVNVQKDWCELVEIEVTPTIFFNGYKLPEPYQVDDIKYLLD